ncbi:class I SAM-dependent methyltransferase [Thermodesulfobacteriota bacterium]
MAGLTNSRCTLRRVGKMIPGVRPLYGWFKQLGTYYRFKTMSTEEIFTDIFRGRKFGGRDSVSGPGSDLYQTRIIIKELPVLFRTLGISTVPDIPCGYFNWMSSCDLDDVIYIGADIVEELVQSNKRQWSRSNVSFQKLNLISEELLKSGLVFCRDCLVHLCFKDILGALTNVCRSEAEYLLTTTFPSQEENRDIVTGDWRPLNLQRPPFNLPEPVRVINERYAGSNGKYADKSLGLWRIHDIAGCI